MSSTNSIKYKISTSGYKSSDASNRNLSSFVMTPLVSCWWPPFIIAPCVPQGSGGSIHGQFQWWIVIKHDTVGISLETEGMSALSFCHSSWRKGSDGFNTSKASLRILEITRINTLGHYVTSRKVGGSNPDVTGFFKLT
jgi:hypothetical protein